MMVLGYPPTEGMLMGIRISGYISESGMTNCGSGSLELLATTLNMEWEIMAQARLIWCQSLYITTIFPLVRDKVRWWRKLNCKFAQYPWTSSNMCRKHLLGCWCPLPRSDPSKMNLGSCRRLVSEASVWRMGVPTTVLAWMKIKTVIFHMANSITVLAFLNLLSWKWNRIWNSCRWTVIQESDTLKYDGLGVVWNMKGHILVISKTNSVLVVDKLFPRSDDGLEKCRLNCCICMYICSSTRNWMWIICNFIFFLLMRVLLNILNRNRFRMVTLLLKFVLLKLKFQL